MRIALQKSGGRGEYELTGSYGDVAASDLLGETLSYELWPGQVVDGRSEVRRAQGKIRIRRTSTTNARHAYLVLSDVVLLPEPIREVAVTTSQVPFVRKREYAITDIDVDLLDQSGGALLSPKTLWLQNKVGRTNEIDFAERIAVVQAVWDEARTRPAGLGPLLQQHEAAVVGGDHQTIADAARAVRRHFKTDFDVLPHIVTDFGLDLFVPDGGIPAPGVSDDALDDVTDPAEAKKKKVMAYRKVAERGAAGRRFSALVRSAYDHRCAFCGVRYPKLATSATSGVDGAHILPWAKFDLNSVTNGLCLCKRCHWAFDNGVYRLDYVASRKRYSLSIPTALKAEAKSEGFDLSWFEDNVGNIADWKLPTDKSLWPQPEYIKQLNDELYS